LGVAVAGKRQIPAAAAAAVEEELVIALRALAARLESLRDGRESSLAEAGRAQLFSLAEPARLTLVTGLADGADRTAADVFLALRKESPDVERVLGAVLPCDAAQFVSDSPVEDTAGFQRQAGACGFIIELDGTMRQSSATPFDGRPGGANGERNDAFVAQAEILLRQADVLIAVDDPTDEGKVGGTRQTVRNALQLGLPVILIRLGIEGMAILRARADFDQPVLLPRAAAGVAVWRLAGELVGADSAGRDPEYVEALVQEFFAPHSPPWDYRVALWSWFEGLFSRSARRSPPTAPPASPSPASPAHAASLGASSLARYRRRASALSRYYAGVYRGSFLLGYFLAVVAIALAVGSLVRLLWEPAGPTSTPLLIVLSVLKLSVLVWIARLARNANHQRLAHRAADYRYLSERLRAMSFLPGAGSLRAPSSWSLPYTTRVMEQGVIDRIFLGVVREVNPLDASMGVREGAVIRQTPAVALDVVRREWLVGQRQYHERNARTLGRMSEWFDHLSRRINQAVILIVAADVLVLILHATGVVPEVFDHLLHHDGATLLVSLAAILPAAIASLNGVRFQSECARLADRSEHMAVQLKAIEDRAGLLDLRPLRALDALRLAEDVATLTIDEVAEWSAIYGKEFVEM
jgi:hypothetical protein